MDSYGIGSFRPNVALLGWPSDPERVGVLRTLAGLKRSTILIHSDGRAQDPWEVPEGSIDVWWRGEANGHLMLLLAHLLAENRAWRARPIGLLRTVPSEAGREEATRHLTQLTVNARIEATPVVLVSDDFLATLHDRSRHAAVVFLGYEPPPEGGEVELLDRMQGMMAKLGTTVLVWSAGDAQFEA